MHPPPLIFTRVDLERAVRDGVLTEQAALAFLEWVERNTPLDHTDYDRYRQQLAQGPQPLERSGRGINLINVAYYSGALLIIGAFGWFLGEHWERLGPGGILVTALIYLAIFANTGWQLRFHRGFPTAGGLLLTVAVSLTPLIVYSILKLIGVWPPDEQVAGYQQYFTRLHVSWIVLEVATIAVGLSVLRRVQFGFLTAPIACSFWFLSLDGAELLIQTSLDWRARCWVSISVGLLCLLVGNRLDHYRKARLEDLGFWFYLFGLVAFWGGLTALESSSEMGRAFYCLINIGLVLIGIRLRRGIFIAFGGLGVHLYLGHLAFEVFKDSILFPFALALLGLSLILTTVKLQHRFLTVQTTSPGGPA